MRLEQKVAIVTGAASGIGRATALRFAREGASVVLADLSDRVEEVAREISSGPGHAVAVVADVSRDADAARIVEAAVGAHGRIDVLFNNAGIQVNHSVDGATESDWDRVIDTNLKSVFLLSRKALPHMMRQRGGSIVNTGSAAGVVGCPGVAAYCASKGGVVVLTKQMALDYARFNIRVNCVAPGVVETAMIERFVREQAHPDGYVMSVKRTIPFRRFAAPEDVANAVLFLASDEASYVTGVTLPVDGGFLAG